MPVVNVACCFGVLMACVPELVLWVHVVKMCCSSVSTFVIKHILIIMTNAINIRENHVSYHKWANVHITLVNYFTYCTLGPWVRVRVRLR